VVVEIVAGENTINNFLLTVRAGLHDGVGSVVIRRGSGLFFFWVLSVFGIGRDGLQLIVRLFGGSRTDYAR